MSSVTVALDHPLNMSLNAGIYAPSMLPADAFADAAETDDSGKDYVHIRIQQRNGKKSLTTIQVRSGFLDECLRVYLRNAVWVAHALQPVRSLEGHCMAAPEYTNCCI